MDDSAENVRIIQADSISWRHDLTARAAHVTVDNINSLISDAGFGGAEPECHNGQPIAGGGAPNPGGRDAQTETADADDAGRQAGSVSEPSGTPPRAGRIA